MSLESENDELKTRIFQVEHMNGMLDAQIQQLREDVRVMSLRNESLEAQIRAMQAAPEPSQHSRWFWYQHTVSSIQIRGFFDMLEVGWCEATKKGSGPWNARIQFRGTNTSAVLQEAAFWEFGKSFDAYLKRT